VSNPGDARYSFPGWLDGIGGNFSAADGQIIFPVDLNDSFIDILSYRLPATGRFSATEFSFAPDSLGLIVATRTVGPTARFESTPHSLAPNSNRRRVGLAVFLRRQLGQLVGLGLPFVFVLSIATGIKRNFAIA
jgi:hypothetical protein